MEDLAPAIVIAVVLAFAWGLKYLQTRKRQMEREMLHRERMLAMEKGIPLPELPVPEEDTSKSLLETTESRKALPRLTLGLGLILTTLGVGLLVAFLLSPLDDLRDVWTLGFVPLLVGAGFLIYYVLIRWTDS